MNASERRGALIVLAIFALGAARDLWELCRPVALDPPPVVVPADDTPPLASAADPPQPGATPAAAPPGAAPLVELNRADGRELETLPGVGPVLAGRILAYRAAHGPFHAVEELLAIRGVGPKSFARIRLSVRVEVPREVRRESTRATIPP